MESSEAAQLAHRMMDMIDVMRQIVLGAHEHSGKSQLLSSKTEGLMRDNEEAESICRADVSTSPESPTQDFISEGMEGRSR